MENTDSKHAINDSKDLFKPSHYSWQGHFKQSSWSRIYTNPLDDDDISSSHNHSLVNDLYHTIYHTSHDNDFRQVTRTGQALLSQTVKNGLHLIQITQFQHQLQWSILTVSFSDILISGSLNSYVLAEYSAVSTDLIPKLWQAGVLTLETGSVQM